MTKLFWIDMEMTGLDVSKEVIIEVAAIITDIHLNEIATYHAVVRQDQRYLDQMDDWNTKTHGDSGLTARVPTGKDINVVEQDLLDLIQEYFGKERPTIAGNSIAQDRLFIDKYLHRFASKLHYRMMDVTSWKIYLKSVHKVVHPKKGSHRALDDIRESISEMKTYISFLDLAKVQEFVKNNPPPAIDKE